MPSVEYVVGRADGAWIVRLRDKTFGPYSTQDAAATAAVKAARKAEDQGFEAVVVFEGDEAEASEAHAA